MNLLLSTLAENACTVLEVFGRMFSSGTSELTKNKLDGKALPNVSRLGELNENQSMRELFGKIFTVVHKPLDSKLQQGAFICIAQTELF